MNGQIEIDKLPREDLLRLLQRDRYVKEVLSTRLSQMWVENAELLAAVQEMQQELQRLAPREEPEYASNGAP